MSSTNIKYPPDQDPIGLCNRCKSKQGTIMCGQCSPYNVFCLECDQTVHSYPSKMNHEREKIFCNTQPQLNQSQNNTFFSSMQTYNSPSNLSYERDSDENKNTGSVSKNYINEIQKIYEDQKEQLINKNYLLQKNMNENAQTYESRIGELEQQLKEETKKNGMNVKVLIENHEDEIKRIVQEKDAQINYLYSQNYDLEKANKELMAKVNEYSELLNQNKIMYSDKVSSCENTIKNLNKDCEDMRDFYEKKITFYTQNFASEKNKIISAYENTIEKLNDGYIDSKNKYLSVIHQRDCEIKDLINSHKSETDTLNSQISTLKEEINVLKGDQERLLKNKDELEAEINTLTNLLERSKKEIKFNIKEKNKLQEDYKNLENENSDLKRSNTKLNRLTHGKLKKATTFGNSAANSGAATNK
ncbi:MAG: hypothetical protein MJ252_19570 [archaeon]|nr:hypothetical protein [archaeon]